MFRYVIRCIALLSALALVSVVAVGCKKENVPVGGKCSSRDDCKNRNPCLKMPGGKGVCTRICRTFPKDDCPEGTKCTPVNLTVKSGARKMGSAKGIKYCLPAK